MKFSPNSIFKGKNSDGTTFTAEEWDFEVIANIEVTMFFVSVLFAAAFAAIASPILLILSIPVFGTNHGKILNIIGIAVASLFLYSCSGDGGILISALWFFCDPPMIKFWIAIAIASLITHTTLLLFGYKIIRIFVNDNNWLVPLIGICCVIMFIGFIYGKSQAPILAKKTFDKIQAVDDKHAKEYKSDEQIAKEREANDAENERRYGNTGPNF